MADYYVATTGNDDTGDGTSGNPYLTIQMGADVATPGDTVIVRDGTYAPGTANILYIYTTGTSGSPIIFKSENKYGAILDGNSASANGIVIGNGASYIQIQDFEIKNTLNMGIISNNAPNASSYVTIEGNKIHDIGRYESESAYGLCGIYEGIYNHHWNITRNLIYNIGRTGPDNYYMNKDHAIYTGSKTGGIYSHHNNMTYNVMYLCSGVAITMGSNDDLIANNTIAWSNYNSQGGSAIFGIDDTVENLTIANNIFILDAYDEPFVIWTAPNPTYPGWSIKNNMVYGARMNLYSNAATIAAMDGGNYGQTDCENAEVDPLLVSATRSSPPYNFSLQSNSPAINAGTNVGLLSDFDGNPIIGNPDIGAYENQDQDTVGVYGIIFEIIGRYYS